MFAIIPERKRIYLQYYTVENLPLKFETLFVGARLVWLVDFKIKRWCEA